VIEIAVISLRTQWNKLLSISGFPMNVVIVTGANTGICLWTANELAKAEAKVILACRERLRGIEVEKVVNHFPLRIYSVYEAIDLSNLRSIRFLFVNKLKSMYSIIDVLVDNAGLLLQRK